MANSNDSELIDLNTNFNIEWNSVPLIPLPQSDSPLGKDIFSYGENPFDNAALQVMNNDNDPFELVSWKAQGISQAVSNASLVEEISLIEESSLPVGVNYSTIGDEVGDNANENLKIGIQNNFSRKQSDKSLERVEFLSCMKSGTTSGTICGGSSCVNLDVLSNQVINHLRHSSQELLNIPGPSETDLGNNLKRKISNSSNTALYTDIATPEQLSPISFVRTRVEKCIAEARKSFPLSIKKKLDFSSLISPSNRRRSLDSLKIDKDKFSPHNNPRFKTSRRSLDLQNSFTPAESPDLTRVKLQQIDLHYRAFSNQYYSPKNSELRDTNLFPSNTFKLHKFNLVPGISDLKNELCGAQRLSKDPEQDDLYLKINKMESKLVNNKILADESMVEYDLIESDEENKVVIDNDENKQDNRSNNHDTFSPGRKEKTLQQPNSKCMKTVEMVEDDVSNKCSRLKSIATPQSSCESSRSTVHRVNSLGCLETYNKVHLKREKLERTTRRRSDGNIPCKSGEQMTKISLSSRTNVKQLKVPATRVSLNKNNPLKISHTRSGGRVSKPFKSLSKVLQKL